MAWKMANTHAPEDTAYVIRQNAPTANKYCTVLNLVEKFLPRQGPGASFTKKVEMT